MMHLFLAFLTALIPLALGYGLWSRPKLQSGTPPARAAAVATAALILGLGTQVAQAALLAWTGLDSPAEGGQYSDALLSTFLFTAPLDEGAKVLALWPLYRARKIQHPLQGIALAVCAAAGFAAAETFWQATSGTAQWATARSLVALPSHFLCAALWGATLGVLTPGGWFSLAWLCGMLLHGLSDHFAFGRGMGVVALALPLVLTQAALAYAMARRALRHQAELDCALESLDESAFDQWTEPASVREVWLALEPQRRRLFLPWVAIGGLVTAGTGLTTLALSLYVGHAIGLDFSLVDEENVRSNGPLLLLAAALGTAFPLAGYLVARASNTKSVLEPALGAAMAVFGAVLLLSFTTPIAAVVALALAPVAFVLASGGAWFGLGR